MEGARGLSVFDHKGVSTPYAKYPGPSPTLSISALKIIPPIVDLDVFVHFGNPWVRSVDKNF